MAVSDRVLRNIESEPIFGLLSATSPHFHLLYYCLFRGSCSIRVFMRYVVYIYVSLLLLLTGCNNRLPENAAALFGTWFIHPTFQNRTAVEELALSAEGVDSLVQVIRSRTLLSGPATVQLRDENHTRYTVGYDTPDSFSFDSTYPLIIYLHGGVGTLKNTKGEKAYLMFSDLQDSMPLFLASPSANRQAPWWSEAGLNRILQTLRFMSLHFPVDPQKVFLAGVSDGATGCYAAANTIAAPFAGFFSISGFGGMLPRLGMELYPANLMQRPIYDIHAGKDRLYPIEMVNGFLDQLERNGVAIKRKVYPEEQHGFDYRSEEYDTLTALIRRWSKPQRASVKWHFLPGYPARPDNLLSWRVQQNEKASCSAFWRNDSLHISTDNLKSVGVISPISERRKITVKTEDFSMSISPAHESNQLLMDKMQHFCFPNINRKNCYRIELNI